jgi:hypothetical protein
MSSAQMNFCVWDPSQLQPVNYRQLDGWMWSAGTAFVALNPFQQLVIE